MSPSPASPVPSEEVAKALRGELFNAFVPELVAARKQCKAACDRFNNAGDDVSRRRMVELWRDINNLPDLPPLPPPPSPPAFESDLQQTPSLTSSSSLTSSAATIDAALFATHPWIEPPIRIDYGTNIRLGRGVFLNFNTTIIDSCLVTIGDRTLLGPNCSIYAGTHPLDPAVRRGIEGPELGREVHIEEDVWVGGNVIVLPGVRVGRGSTVGAGSVVTKDVPPFHVVAGNPARVIRKIVTAMDPEQQIPK